MKIQVCKKCGAIMTYTHNRKFCEGCGDTDLMIIENMGDITRRRGQDSTDLDTDLEEKIGKIIEKRLKKEVPEVEKLQKYKEYINLGMEFFDGAIERIKEVLDARKDTEPQAVSYDIHSLPLRDRINLMKGQKVGPTPPQRSEIVAKVPESARKEETQVEDVDNTQDKEVSDMVEKDMQEKIGLVINFIKNMDNEEFRRKVEEKEDLIGQYKTFIKFLPAQYRGFVLSLTIDQIKDVLETEVPEKYEILEELQGWGYLEDQFTELKKLIGG